MHIVQTYALNCGVKIDRPYVFEHYTSIPTEKFISFHKKVYPYFSEVIELIRPELQKRGISIVQCHAAQDGAEAEISIFDNLSFGQWAYLIKHSLLHFGEDDFLFDLAGYYDIPRVILFSNTYPATTKPYWGSQQKEIILETTGPHIKPSFSIDPNLNFVRYIKPERIAESIMNLLGISWKAPYETVYAGQQYRPQHDMIELVPNVTEPIELIGKVQTVCVRMDYEFNEQFLLNVLDKNRASIVTNQPIRIGLLQFLRTKIAEIAYLVNDSSDIQFAKDLAKLNLPYALLTYSSNEQLREKFFEICPISTVVVAKLENIKELKSGLSGLKYKSGKRLLCGKKEFKGLDEFKKNQNSKCNEFSPCPENPDNDFLHELEFFLIVKPV